MDIIFVIIDFVIENKATTIDVTIFAKQAKNKSLMLQILLEKQQYQVTNERKLRIVSRLWLERNCTTGTLHKAKRISTELDNNVKALEQPGFGGFPQMFYHSQN